MMAKPSNRNLRDKVDAMIPAPCQRCSRNAGRLITAGHCRDIDAPPNQMSTTVRHRHAYPLVPSSVLFLSRHVADTTKAGVHRHCRHRDPSSSSSPT